MQSTSRNTVGTQGGTSILLLLRLSNIRIFVVTLDTFKLACLPFFLLKTPFIEAGLSDAHRTSPTGEILHADLLYLHRTPLPNTRHHTHDPLRSALLTGTIQNHKDYVPKDSYVGQCAHFQSHRPVLSPLFGLTSIPLKPMGLLQVSPYRPNQPNFTSPETQRRCKENQSCLKISKPKEIPW